MNILITGGQGFIGKSIAPILANKHTVYAMSHQELDLFDLLLTEQFIIKNNIDCILHTAIIIGRYFAMPTYEQAWKNLLMFENIFYAARHCKYFINFAAGCEFDVRKNICNVSERALHTTICTEIGGLIKNIIAKKTIATTSSPIGYNLRIAGCFGKYEKEDRFIKANLNRIRQNQPIIIHQNRFMDFIAVEDIALIIEYILDNPNICPKDINCVYPTKYTLKDIAFILASLTGTNVPIIIEKEGLGLEYTLDGLLLSRLQLPLLGLVGGIQKCL